MSNQVVVFSYDGFAPDVQAQLRETAEAIRSSARRQVEEVIATGRALLAAKAALEHGQFGPWLSAEFSWSIKTAQRYMAAAEAFGSNTTCVSHLPVAVVYRLARLNAPARERVLEAGAKGENDLVPLIVHEAAEAKQAAAKAAAAAKRSPEAKAREEASRLRLWQRIKREDEKIATRDAEQLRKAAALVRDIIDVEPNLADKLEQLLNLPHYMVKGELAKAKADVQNLNTVRHRFGVRDAELERQDIFDTLSDESRNYQHAPKVFAGNLMIAIDCRLWDQDRKSASGRIVKSESLHGFVHDSAPYGISATWRVIEELLEYRPDVLDRWNAVRKSEGGA